MNMGIALKYINRILDHSKEWPVVITNKDVPLIQESSLIVETLESEGYKVDTFVDLPNETYGLRISK
jgi:hypothetical protein